MNDSCPIDDLAEEFARRLRNGESCDVESFVGRCPEHPNQLREALLAVEMMEQLKPRREWPEVLGEYRILREIGRGGMGIVYEADHKALGRRVAIKVLPIAADEKTRERFRREAQAAARLHHTNIVPVFGVGERDGQCYYVMQRIYGRALQPATQTGESADATSRVLVSQHKSNTFRAVAEIGIQVADALQYAHAQGVLHRDIKPSNLILDENGIVWVSDFGVAKLVEAPDLTRTGDIVGTLRYMPPERFAGVSDPRGDVYSLGITLTELLTAKPVFPDLSAEELIHRISTAQRPRPRSIHPTIPPDLETVVLKATARDPEQRYQTAGELADDLRRFIADRPVLARRTGPLAHLYRWGRRNPALASSLAVVLLSLTLATGVSLYAAFRTSRALESETKQRDQAEQMAALAVTALNRTFDRFAPARLMATAPNETEDGIELPPRLATPPESVPLLEDLLRSYEQIAESARVFPRLRSQTAEANQRIGDLRQRLGRYHEATSAYRTAMALQVNPVMRARAMNELGRVLRATTGEEEARRMHDQAARELMDATPEIATLPESRYELARAYYMSDQRPAMRPGPPGPPFFDLGHRAGEPHPLAPMPGRPGPPGRSSRRAIDLLEKLVNDFPTVPEYRHLLACCYRDEPPGRGGERGLRLLRELVRDFPGVPDYRLDLCEALAQPGGGRHGPNGPSGLSEALALSADLVRQYPDVPEFAAAHGRFLVSAGFHSMRLAQAEEAEKSYRRALAIQGELVKKYPSATAYAFWLCLMERSLAECLLQTGRYREATLHLLDTIERAERIDSPQGLPGLPPFLGMTYFDLGRAFWASGDDQLAAEAWRKARAGSVGDASERRR